MGATGGEGRLGYFDHPVAPLLSLRQVGRFAALYRLGVAWQTDDIKRSIRRYLTMTLESPPWKLRVERREVKDEERPVGVVVAGPKGTTRARAALIQGNVEEVMPITITLYPKLAEGTADSLRSARLEADLLKDQLSDLLNTGLTVTTEESGRLRHWAGPLRLPLWNYEGVPLTGKDKAGPEAPHDVLWVQDESISVDAIQDPEDPRRWTVVANFRVSIERPGRVAAPEETMDVEEIIGEFAGEPG